MLVPKVGGPLFSGDYHLLFVLVWLLGLQVSKFGHTAGECGIWGSGFWV